MKNRYKICAMLLSILFLLPFEAFAALPDLVMPLAEEDDGYTKMSVTSYYGPGPAYSSAHTLPSNTKVTILAIEDDYYWVSYRYNGNTYYAHILASKIRTTYVPDDMISEEISAVSVKDNYIAKNVTVYGGPGENYPSIGSIGNANKNMREPVKIILNFGNYYYIEYLTISGPSKRGFVKAEDLMLPSKDWAKPIHSGTLCQDYEKSPTNTNGHDGIDILCGTTPVYAIADGTIKMHQVYLNISGTDYLISYGNYIELVFTEDGITYKAIYGHLSSFQHATPIIPKENTRQISAYDVDGEVTNTLKVTGTTTTTKTVQKGELLGYTGDTGKSSAPHLHFELRVQTSSGWEKVDPFLYVAFPNV